MPYICPTYVCTAYTGAVAAWFQLSLKVELLLTACSSVQSDALLLCLSRVVPATVACMHAAWFLHKHMCCVHACDPAAAAPACGSCLYIHHALFGAPSLSCTYYFTSHHSCLVVQWVLPLVTISELVMMRYIEPFARDWHAY